MQLTPLLNRDGNLPGDGWFHLVPFGEFPHPDSGVTQIIDQAAVDAMLNRFNQEAAGPNFAGLLIDQEHWSYDLAKSSESFGWVKELQNRADGLWGRIEFSDLGETAVKNRRYKFISPVFWPKDQIETLGNRRVRPLRIDSLGFTNSPNLKGMVPFTNRAGADAPAEDQNQTPKHNMKLLANRLGLSADASEDSILAALDSLAARAKSAENKVTALDGENTELKNRLTVLVDDSIADELDAHGIREEVKRIAVTKALKPMLNRADRIAFLKDCVAPDKEPAGKDQASGRPVFNRAATKTPADRQGGGNEKSPKEVAAEQHSVIEEIRLQNRCTYEQAQSLAMTRKPALFGINP